MSNSVDSATTTEEINISTEEVKLVDLVKQEALNMLKEKITSEIGDKQVDKQLLMKLLVIGMETVEKTKVKTKKPVKKTETKTKKPVKKTSKKK